MESIDNEIKQHRKKIHDFELADIKTKEKEERQKKEYKVKGGKNNFSRIPAQAES
jgi:hypothetical protein